MSNYDDSQDFNQAAPSRLPALTAEDVERIRKGVGEELKAKDIQIVALWEKTPSKTLPRDGVGGKSTKDRMIFDFVLFFLWCIDKQLNPFTGEAYLQYNGDSSSPVGCKATYLAGIWGMLKIADATGTYAGMDQPIFYHDETGEVLYCAVTGYRIVQGIRCQFTSNQIHMKEFKPKYVPMIWRDKPHSMLAKCARADLLRIMFPAALGGVYEASEMQGEIDLGGPDSEPQKKQAAGDTEAGAFRKEAKRQADQQKAPDSNPYPVASKQEPVAGDAGGSGGQSQAAASVATETVSQPATQQTAAPTPEPPKPAAAKQKSDKQKSDKKADSKPVAVATPEPEKIVVPESKVTDVVDLDPRDPASYGLPSAEILNATIDQLKAPSDKPGMNAAQAMMARVRSELANTQNAGDNSGLVRLQDFMRGFWQLADDVKMAEVPPQKWWIGGNVALEMAKDANTRTGLMASPRVAGEQARALFDEWEQALRDLPESQEPEGSAGPTEPESPAAEEAQSQPEPQKQPQLVANWDIADKDEFMKFNFRALGLSKYKTFIGNNVSLYSKVMMVCKAQNINTEDGLRDALGSTGMFDGEQNPADVEYFLFGVMKHGVSNHARLARWAVERKVGYSKIAAAIVAEAAKVQGPETKFGNIDPFKVNIPAIVDAIIDGKLKVA